jgi:hypothetical protein
MFCRRRYDAGLAIEALALREQKRKGFPLVCWRFSQSHAIFVFETGRTYCTDFGRLASDMVSSPMSPKFHWIEVWEIREYDEARKRTVQEWERVHNWDTLSEFQLMEMATEIWKDLAEHPE